MYISEFYCHFSQMASNLVLGHSTLHSNVADCAKLYTSSLNPECPGCVPWVSVFIDYHLATSCHCHYSLWAGKKDYRHLERSHLSSLCDIGYEPAGLTMHPPPKTIEGGFIFCA